MAAFPEGHPSAESLDADARVLVAKADAGAEFAVTQLFFRAADYADLVERVRALGCDIPILPGHHADHEPRARSPGWPSCRAPSCPTRWSRGSTASPSRPTSAAWASRSPPSCARQLLERARPGLHFYTLNRSRATLEIFEALRITA